MVGKAAATGASVSGLGSTAIAFVAIVLIAIGYLVLTSHNGSSGNNFPSFSKGTDATPAAFANIQGSSGSVPTEKLAKLTQTGLANANQLTILYNGSMNLQESLVSINSPLYVSDMKYGKDQRFDINITNVQGIGHIEIVYINTTNGTFTCMNINSGALSNQDYQAVLFGNHSLTCRITDIIAGLDFSQLANFNWSQLTNEGVNLQYQQVYQSTYHGMPCTYIAGTVSASGSSSTGGLFQMCMSDVYYVPLSMSLILSGSGKSFSVTVNETSITNSASKSQIDSIPGPIV